MNPLPTVEEIRDWMQMPATVLALAEKAAAIAVPLRAAVSSIYTQEPIWVYFNTETKKAALSGGKPQDNNLVASVISDLVDVVPSSTSLESAPWLKIAFSSPTIRNIGEWSGYFPGRVGGVINNPHPTTTSAALAGGLLGAGLGYGAGWLGETLLPNRWDKGKLRRTLATLGGLAGAAPAAAVGLANWHTGDKVNDLSSLAETQPKLDTSEFTGGAKISSDDLYVRSCARISARGDFWIKEAADALDTMAGGSAPPINVDALGRTLWATGDPAVAGMTMGAMAAASKMPSPEQDPGWVTPAQMGELAARMGAGYVSGRLVGAALGILAGMPEETQNTLARSGMYAGLVKAVLPHLFG